MPAAVFTRHRLLEVIESACTVASATRRLGAHRATVWRALRRAEDDGLVERVPVDAGDGWLLTAAGERMLSEHRRHLDELLARPSVAEAISEALGPRMRRPRGRPRVDGTYELRLPLEEPTNAEEAWWQGDGGWSGPTRPRGPSSAPAAPADHPVDQSLGPLFEAVDP